MTGMSGTGKSSVLEKMRLLGFQTVDTDEGGWTEWSEADGGYVWREERIAELLADDEGPSLYVSGTVSNQGRFLPGRDRAAPTPDVYSRDRRHSAACRGCHPARGTWSRGFEGSELDRVADIEWMRQEWDDASLPSRRRQRALRACGRPSTSPRSAARTRPAPGRDTATLPSPDPDPVSESQLGMHRGMGSGQSADEMSPPDGSPS